METKKPENEISNMTDKYREVVGDFYADFHRMRTQRSGSLRQFQNNSFEDYLKISRELFWTSIITKSEDLAELDLDFALPFIRKEVLDYVGRIVSMQMTPEMTCDGVGQLGIKVLQIIDKKWRLKSKDKVEKFWQMLYSIMNGTVCLYVGYDNGETPNRKLTQFDPKTGQFAIDEKTVKLWDDVLVEIVPIEDMYLNKMEERNIQKQGKTIRKYLYTQEDFDKEFPVSKFPDAKHVVPGTRIDKNSLFYDLLGSAITSSDKIFVLKKFDTDKDTYEIMASGVWLNRLGKDTQRPNPFLHKRQPYVWSINEAIDEKFAYGLSMPFKLKDPHKILNTSYTMLVERELRTIDPPILTSDFEAPNLIFGGKKVIPVNDVNAYKELNIGEASNQFFTMQNSMQGLMSSFGQGGFSQVAPSRQPKAAREIMVLETMKQQALGNALIMYYDLVYQEILLRLKTSLQFYAVSKFSDQKENIFRALSVPDFALSQGGIGNLEVRIVKKPQEALNLYFEAVKKSIDNGKITEIIELPVDMIVNLEFFITDIKLEPEKSTDMEKTLYSEQVLRPLMEYFIPSGLASPEKVFLRWLEKNGEAPSDYASDNVMGMYMSGSIENKDISNKMGKMSQNILQSNTGMDRGGESMGGYPELMQ